ncbi:MAG TPA: zinc ribbon domain-containing protein [Ktedonobacteraceae bacterium]|nr:zinc ribbon domain-containing protein [Ktedonobacteraceae bacterium]
MATCTSCGSDVSGKKFCPDCGTPVQTTQAQAATTTCSRCGGTIKANAAFCMHCGTSQGVQALASTAAPVTAVVQSTPHLCPACRTEIPATSAFCTNCGQSVQTGQVSTPTATAPGQTFCANCGSRNNPGVRFCNSCGQALTPGVAPQTGPYQPQYNTNYPSQQPYSQPQYNPGYTQPPPYGQPQYNTNYPPQQPYAQTGYAQPAPMLGQQPMVLRCPVCMAMAPMGTPNCPSCHTSLAGVVPTSSVAPAQGQQQGGFGGMLQGRGGNMAIGALGGAAAVIGGEMLLHNLEHRHEYGREDYGERRDEGLLGNLGDLANDIGLF